MRDIKFKALKKGTWYDFVISGGGFSWSNKLIKQINDRTEPEFNHIQNFEAFVQHTGLKDKKGREIYQGDIVRCLIEKGKNSYENQEVVFEEGAFGLKVKCLDEQFIAFFWIFKTDWNDLEVVGNVYENPELLEREA